MGNPDSTTNTQQPDAAPALSAPPAHPSNAPPAPAPHVSPPYRPATRPRQPAPLRPLAASASPAPASASPAPASGPSFLGLHWVYAFILFDLACVLALIVPGIGPLRMVLRIALFAGSLALLVLLPAGRSKHPAAGAAIAALAIVALGLLHPDTASPLAGLAAIAMHAAILAPIWWVSGLRIDARVIRNVAIILWAFHSASAAVGVLQMHFPGRFEPEPSAIFLARGADLVEGARITLAGGQQVFRPMGLGDVPGGAAGSGLACIVFALGIWTIHRPRGRPWTAAACAASMAAGLFCIYLSQVRSILIMALVAMGVFALVLLVRRDYRRLGRYVTLVGLVVVTGTAWAVWVGGEMTVNRLRTLVEDHPATVYYHGRGWALHYTLDAISTYPLGAGLGRWGMINHYFAEGTGGAKAQRLWAEIQWTGWLFDGGVPLMIAYGFAVLLAVWIAWKIAIDPRGGGAGGAGAAGSAGVGTRAGAAASAGTEAGEICLWAAVLCASNVATLAVTFNYPIFMSQGGLEFWLLNACLWAAWRGAGRG